MVETIKKNQCRISRFLGILLNAAILVATLGWCQLNAQVTSGNLVGNVYDPSAAIVSNAEVTVTNEDTNVSASTHTTSAGDFRFENLPVGTYTVIVSAAGFSKTELKGVTIQLNATITQNVTLRLTQATTTVEVSEAVASIDTTTAQLQSTFDVKQVTDLPSTANGSGVLNLSLLNAGVATSGSVGAGTGPSVAGQRPRNNNFTVEGIDNNSGTVTGPMVSVPNDAVAEFSVLQNQFSPDFGHSSGGQFNTVVKSGTNQFHGMLYEYLQNKNFNAADNLSAVDGTPLHPRFDNNRFGGNVGGPILRNKLFFFVDYEYNPVGEAGSAGLIYAPTAAGYSILSSTPGINQTNLAILQKYLPAAATATPAAATPYGSYPLISTLAAGPEYQQVLTPQGIQGTPIPIGQLSIPTPSYSNSEVGVASVDYNLSDKDSMRGRFILNRNGSIDTAASLPVFFTTTPDNNYLATFSEYHNFSPTVINEFRFGYNRNSNQDPSGNFSFPGLDAFPNLVFYELGGAQLGPDPNAPQFGYQNTYQLTNNLTWTKGAHSFKFGFDGQRLISPQGFTQRARGDYEYNYLSDYLFDFTPDYIAQRSVGKSDYWGNRWLTGFYANDSWKVNPNLTVNLGLRYEYDTVPAGEQTQSLNAIANDPGLITFAAPKAQTTNFMPRIGVAYSPGSSGKTSFRAGFGINYDVLFDNLGLLSLPPELSVTYDQTGNGGSNFLASGGLPGTFNNPTYTTATARAATSGYVPNVQRPESIQWNFGIQHEFAGNYVFETRYVGTRGIDLDVQDQLNIQPVVNQSNALPVYFSMPSQATLNSLKNTLAPLENFYDSPAGGLVPAYYQAGFNQSIITSYQPYGSSIYHGWANQLTRRFSNGLQFVASYTWSHAIDNSTADVHSTASTPRRPEDSQDVNLDRSSSALDHRNRITLSGVYDVPYFKRSQSWFMKNLVGNWELAPIYTFQSGTLYTVQSGQDSLLSGDTAPMRAMVNPNGNPSIGSNATPLTNSAGQTVAYVATNPNAGYVVAPEGTFPNAGRNTGHFPPIDDIDLFAAKRFSFREHAGLEFSIRVFNIMNHPQYVGGNVNDVAPNSSSLNGLGMFEPTNVHFNQPQEFFSSNPRAVTLGAKFTF
jgi:hypothetical protein